MPELMVYAPDGNLYELTIDQFGKLQDSDWQAIWDFDNECFKQCGAIRLGVECYD